MCVMVVLSLLYRSRITFGKKAYAFLEEYLTTGYTGSAGLHLPSEVKDRLDKLRRLIDGP